jgi:hypothetical protein
VLQYEAWAHKFITKLQLVPEYDGPSGSHQICIPDSPKLRLGTGIAGYSAASSTTTQDSISNTQGFRTALMALMETHNLG